MTTKSRVTAWLAGGTVVLLVLCAAWFRFSPPKADSSPSPSEEPPWFRDVTEEVGLDFSHDAGPTGAYLMPQSMGSGAAVFDFDGDGLPDLYFLNNGGPNGSPNRLYRQLPGGKFQDVSKGSGLNFAGHNMGVAVGDVNNDGFPPPRSRR